MYNEILKIGSITIYGYGLMIGIGILVAIFTGAYRAKKHSLSDDHVYGIAITGLIFGFICARLTFVAVEPEIFINDPILLISGSGFVVYGGIIGGVLAALIYCKIKKIGFLEYFDICIPSVALAQGFGRIGCFLAGCCYGCPTDSFIGITFFHSELAPNGVKLVPTQLIMSAGDFIIALVLILYYRKKPAKGRTGWLYLILYSVGRFCVEFLRADYRGSVGPFSTSQFISLFIFALGAVMFFFGHKLIKQRPAAAEDAETSEAAKAVEEAAEADDSAKEIPEKPDNAEASDEE
ncbi:MAG: prolipoprotein diacylglyceryl transferase [Clostridia bacterium]|nr:prolipoprotein diacylglyceryl transferase [Clostridia bacterium]